MIRFLNARLLIHSLINMLPCSRQAGLQVTLLSLTLWVWVAVVRHKNVCILPWGPNRSHVDGLGLMTMRYCQQKKKMSVRASSYFGDEPNLETSGSYPTWRTHSRSEQRQAGQSSQLIWQFKKMKEENFTASLLFWVFFFSRVSLEISLVFP